MDPSACRVVYIDERFHGERWISRDGLATPVSPAKGSAPDFGELPPDLQANVNAFLTVFNQVFVCNSGRSFSSKLSEIHESVKAECTPIIACFDVGSETTRDHYFKHRPRFNPAQDSPLPSPVLLKREITFSSESDESYGVQLLSRISSDLQVGEGVKLIIPVAIVQPNRKGSYDAVVPQHFSISRSPYGSETAPATVEDTSDSVDPQMMLQCLDAGALDVVRSPLDKAGIMGLTVHAYRIYKTAKTEQASFMSQIRRGRKQSWVGVEEEKPYAYLREAMVKKLLKGICEPETVIEDYQHRKIFVEESRKAVIAREVGSWGFCGHDFTEDELVYAGYCILNHALAMPELQKWRMSEGGLLDFMQGCRVAYNSFVLYHNFRHAVDVLQSLFYFIVQIGILPSYPAGSQSPPLADNKSPVAKLLTPFEAITLLISAIGHDVGHPGVNNMFLVKLNAPLAQLYNDQSVLEAFHCAAYSQILRRHWPYAFNDKAMRRLMISSILATDMGCHSDYMQQLGQLQETIHHSKSTDSWSPKDRENCKTLTCGLLIKCADISNVARPWAVAEKWTYLLQEEFAHQGEMESAVGMDTTLFGGPPELGNMLKLANGQIGFMTIFAHPLFANVSDIIPAMSFAAAEILKNKGVWFNKAEHEKRKQALKREGGPGDGGNISPRSRSPEGGNRKSRASEDKGPDGYFVSSPLRGSIEPGTTTPKEAPDGRQTRSGRNSETNSRRSSLAAAAAALPSPQPQQQAAGSRRSSGASKKSKSMPEAFGSSLGERGSSNKSSSGQRPLNDEPRSLLPSPITDSQPVGSHDGTNDDRRDQGVSMRAGSKDIPTQDYTPKQRDSLTSKSPSGALNLRDQGVSMRAGSTDIPTQGYTPKQKDSLTSKSPLGAFNFATFNAPGSMKECDPHQNYSAPDAAPRGSATTPDIKLQTYMIGSAHTTQTTSNTSTANGVEARPEALSSSTEATSYMSDRNVEQHSLDTNTYNSSTVPHSQSSYEASPPLPLSQSDSYQSSFHAKRERAQSAPNRPIGSSDSSKSDVRAAAMNGGVMDDSMHAGRGGDKLTTRTMPRRRSRIRLAFWKGLKRAGSSDRDDGEGLMN